MTTLTLTTPRLPKATTSIVIESGAIGQVASLAQNIPDTDRAIVLYDKGVEGIANKIKRDLDNADSIAVPSGESSKSLDQVERITQDMLFKDASRSTVLICVGGGMTTDLGGFIAGVFMRGIPCIHVPTTMMAMADAAIGGDTAVNLGKLKNVLGTRWNPNAVVIDTDILGSLQAQPFNQGMVEIVKTAAVTDPEFFGWLEENFTRILDRDQNALHSCIQHAIRRKIEIFEKDLPGNNHQLLLNFGHTVGHAVEALSQFTLSHGEAVSIGMAAEMQMADTKGADRVLKLLEILNMPLNIPLELNGNDIWEVMTNDKKVLKGDVRMAVPVEIGKGEIRMITKKQFLQSRW